MILHLCNVSDISIHEEEKCKGQNPWKEELFMRIEAYTQVQQLYNTKKINKTSQTSSVHGTDQVEISSFGKDIQVAKQAVKAAPDVREEVTAPIKASIQAGTYQVSGSSFAEKLMEKYEELR